MRDHYDFDKMKSKKNPYAKLLKQSVTIRLDRDTVAYFKELAARTGLPYQQLINLYLRDCAIRKKELALQWKVPRRQATK
jgi:predicted DNA binding CopG/RHH family protein